MMLAAILLVLLQADEYAQRAAALKDTDAEGHYKLGLWCEEQKLADCATKEFEKAIAAKPDHAAARGKLGHRKIQGLWVKKTILDAVVQGIRFPADEETKKLRAKGAYYGRVLDLFWDRDNWAHSIARIDERTGLFEGTLDVELKFTELPGDIPAMGEGIGGKGSIWIDVKKLSEYEKSSDDFVKRAASGGVVLIPPAKTPAILTHELTHCFQGEFQPMWFLEGMATWCAGDGHFVSFFRYFKQKVQDIDANIDHKYVYARGWAFFEYLDTNFGREKAREFVSKSIRDKKEASASAEAVTGKDWATLKKEERDWSAKWVSSFKSK